MNRQNSKQQKPRNGLIRSGLSVQELKAITALRVGVATELGDKPLPAKIPLTGVRSYQTANANQMVAAGMMLQSSQGQVQGQQMYDMPVRPQQQQQQASYPDYPSKPDMYSGYSTGGQSMYQTIPSTATVSTTSSGKSTPLTSQRNTMDANQMRRDGNGNGMTLQQQQQQQQMSILQMQLQQPQPRYVPPTSSTQSSSSSSQDMTNNNNNNNNNRNRSDYMNDLNPNLHVNEFKNQFASMSLNQSNSISPSSMTRLKPIIPPLTSNKSNKLSLDSLNDYPMDYYGPTTSSTTTTTSSMSISPTKSIQNAGSLSLMSNSFLPSLSDPMRSINPLASPLSSSSSSNKLGSESNLLAVEIAESLLSPEYHSSSLSKKNMMSYRNTNTLEPITSPTSLSPIVSPSGVALSSPPGLGHHLSSPGKIKKLHSVQTEYMSDSIPSLMALTPSTLNRHSSMNKATSSYNSTNVAFNSQSLYQLNKPMTLSPRELSPRITDGWLMNDNNIMDNGSSHGYTSPSSSITSFPSPVVSKPQQRQYQPSQPQQQQRPQPQPQHHHHHISNQYYHQSNDVDSDNGSLGDYDDGNDQDPATQSYVDEMKVHMSGVTLPFKYESNFYE